jgi:NhaP-type Na+/H+ or K+/H+ antiporter
MIPVIVSMTGSHTYLETRLFLGWFGPRGLASILFALVVLKELGTAQSELIAIASVATVTASVYAHGLTASPWASRLGQKLASGPEDMPEMMPMEEMPIRWRAF